LSAVNLKSTNTDKVDIVARVALAVTALLSAGVGAAAVLSDLGGTPVRLALYVLAPFVSASACAGLLFTSATVRKMACVYGAAFVIALISVEIYLDHAERSADLRASQSASGPGLAGFISPPELAPTICPSSLLVSDDGSLTPILIGEDGRSLLPFAGPSKTTVLRLAGEDLTRSISDRYGFNNPDSVWDHEARTPVLMIGDSFTYGADVPFGAGFADIVREAQTGAINLGCGGNGPFAALAALKEYGPLVRPEVTVWGYYEGNDLTKDIFREANVAMFRNYLTSGNAPQNLHQRVQEIDRVLWTFIMQTRSDAAPEASPRVNVSTVPSIRDVAKLTQLRTRLGLSQSVSEEALMLLDPILSEMRKTVESWGGRLIVLHLPSETRYATPLGGLDIAAYTRMVRRAVQDHGIGWVSAAPSFNARADDPLSLFEGHYNEAGYAIVADVLIEAIADEAAK